jgi:peptidoglycan-N-acetylglucosamine deacetylase
MGKRYQTAAARLLLLLASILAMTAYAPSPMQTIAGKPSRSTTAKQDANTWVQLEKRYPGSFVTRGSGSSREVALTFDDVPDPRYTPQVLDILARHRVRATFFVVGSRAAKHPALVRRMVREGHLIGNHSYSHAPFSKLSMYRFREQILETDNVLTKLSGYRPRFIRPPYGEVTSRQVDWTRQNGYIIANWDVDSVDWKQIPQDRILANIRKTLQPGSIILQHAGGGYGQDLSGSIKALPHLIQLLRNKGYRPVTLEELLHQNGARR